MTPGTAASPSLHILMVAPQPFFRPRGTPFSVLHRIRGLAMLGHTVELVTYPFGETPEVPGLTVHRAAQPPLVRDVPIGPSLRKVALDVPLFRLASRLARTGRFDLLHTHEEAGWLGARLRRTTGLPHLYDMHSSLPQQLENFGRFQLPPVVAAFRALERYTLRGADGVIAICQALHDHVLESGYDGPLAMIENTLDSPGAPVTDDDVARLRQQLDVGPGPVVVYTGTLEAYQGLDLLLASAAEVQRQVGGVRFVLVGGSPQQSQALQHAAESQGLGWVVRAVPAVAPEQVPAFHALADVLVTTRARGTNVPLKIYQYLRASRPIVATDIPSHTQVLDEEMAQLVRPEPSDIARGLVRVLTDHEHAARLARNAVRVSVERYSEAAYLERLRTLLAQLPAGRRATAREAR
jgi:glycosyltransferase involved in cell wall biosynthesis